MKLVGLLSLAFGLWLATGLQQALPHRLDLFGLRPDFLLIYLSLVCPYLERLRASLTGFSCGVFQGAIAGANLTHYVVSRTVTAVLISTLRDFRIGSTFWISGLTAALATLAAQVAMMFFAAPPGILSFLGATIGSAVYNGVLAIPLSLMLEKLFGPVRHSDGPASFRR